MERKEVLPYTSKKRQPVKAEEFTNLLPATITAVEFNI